MCEFLKTFHSSLSFVHNGQIDNIPTLVQIMVLPRPGDKPLYLPVMVSLLIAQSLETIMPFPARNQYWFIKMVPMLLIV